MFFAVADAVVTLQHYDDHLLSLLLLLLLFVLWSLPFVNVERQKIYWSMATRGREREREETAKTKQNCEKSWAKTLWFSRQKSLLSFLPLSSHLSPSFCLLPHSTRIFSLLIFDIFLGQHFRRVYFHVKNTFSRFRFISYFSFLRLLSDFILLACFLWAGHALAWNWQLRRHQAKF